MATWHTYTSLVEKHTVVGDLRTTRDVFSPQLGSTRDIDVWLPASYERSDKHYPVLYMHDGKNLFDQYVSYSGEWRVDEIMTALGAEGFEAIVVGISNLGTLRMVEYNPYPMPQAPELNGRGDDYIRFMVDTVKPLIDGSFRTLTDSANTGIAGSSMGGLISLYGFLVRPDVFGFCCAFSTAYWFGNNALNDTILQRATGHGKVYLDVGTKEGDTLTGLPPEIGVKTDSPDEEYVRGVRVLRDNLLQRGYVLGESLMYVEEEGAVHREPAWTRRMPDAMRFLLSR
jgi:predicted alpha/beta superfamily hydrolase